jgi:hypothetical protein
MGNETLAATALGITRVQRYSHASGLTPHVPSAPLGRARSRSRTETAPTLLRIHGRRY